MLHICYKYLHKFCQQSCNFQHLRLCRTLFAERPVRIFEIEILDVSYPGSLYLPRGADLPYQGNILLDESLSLVYL